MKRVSARMFFSVMWRGICQVLGWFFGLFGYKRDGKFAKCVWGMFALSTTIVVAIFAGLLLYGLGSKIQEVYFADSDDEEGYWHTYISRNVVMYDREDGNAWVKNKLSGKKTLKGIAWISKPLGEKDSLVVYSDGKKRGYFNKYTGEVALPAQYSHAWVFSDGIASVEENGIIKFIDSKGKQVFERTFAYDPNHEGYVFHGGYCIVDDDSDGKFGLMNTQGVTVLPEEYDHIDVSCDLCYWTLTKGNESSVVDREFKTILPMMACKFYIYNDGIDVTMADNTMRKYDLQGNLIDDFYIGDFSYLEYELEETFPIYERECDLEENEYRYVGSIEHKRARARLCRYTAGNNKDGLMTPEGRVVTLPKYEFISAIGPDTYLCTVSHGDMEVINGKGEKIK